MKKIICLVFVLCTAMSLSGCIFPREVTAEAQAALVAGTLMGLAFVNVLKPVAAVIIKKPPLGGLSRRSAL